MNKIQFLLASAGISILTASAFMIQRNNRHNPHYVELKKEYSKEEAQEIKGAMTYYKQMTANQLTGEIDLNDVQAAKEKMNSMFNSSFKNTRAFANMSWGETGPDNIGGRTRILVVDKNNSNKLYMGAVGGGFWMSTDNGNTWSKRSGNDSSSAIAVSSITQAANGDIYFGTGEGVVGYAGSSWVAQIFQLGEGIFKSTDGGATFTQLTSTKPSNLNSATDQWTYVTKMAADPVNPDKIFAATNGGLKVTTNGGTTWAKPSSLNITSLFLDVENSTDGNTVVASTASNLYISTDGGNTFSANKMGLNGLPASGAASRVEVAIAPSDPNYIYAAIAAGDKSLKGVYKSTDAGATWTAIGLGGSAIFNPLGNQGTYDLAFGVHPIDKDMVFLGGQLEMTRYTPANGWQTIAYWLGSSGKLVHADMHCVTFNPSNPENMYVTTDGGIYRTFNCSAASPVFAEKNKNYSVTQCYGIGANYLGKIVYGTQDNGSGLIGESSNSAQTARDLTGGDGTRCVMSDLLPNFVFTSVVEGELRRAADGGQGGASFKSIFDKNIDLNTNGSSGSAPDGAPDDGALWVAPIDFKEKKVGTELKSIFLMGTNTTVWATQGALKGNPVWFKLFNTGAVGFSAVTMSKDGKNVFAATAGGTLYRITVPSLWDSTYRYEDTIANMPPKLGTVPGPYTYPLKNSIVTSTIGNFPGRFITDLSCDSTGNVLLVTLGNYGNSEYIYKTVEAVDSVAPLFTNITSNLPKMPLYSSICLYGSSSKFMIASELGIWGSDNGGSSWVELNMMNADPTTWHPRVATYEIIEKDTYEDGKGGQFNGSIVYSGTHGRGTFRSTSLSNYNMAPTGYTNFAENMKSIKVYPNPAVDQTTVEYTAEGSSRVSVRIYSLTGNLVKESSFNVVEGKNQLPVNVASLAAGGYVVYLNDNGRKAGASLIKR